MKATEKLQQWYDTERAAGRVLDIKFFPLLPEEAANDNEPLYVLGQLVRFDCLGTTQRSSIEYVCYKCGTETDMMVKREIRR